MQIVKRKRRTQYDQKQYLFTLRSQKSESSKYDIEILFNPKFQRQPFPPEHTFPEFNNDRKYYTSAFILGVDKKILLRSQQQEIMDHQRQVRESLERNRLLALPRPRSQRTLCSVCKEHYQNYHLHISSKEHKNNICQSPYNKHLKSLCKIYIELWDGAQQRADQEQIMRLEQMKKNQSIVQEMEASEEMLDVDNGQQKQIVEEENNFIYEQQNYINRKINKSNLNQIVQEKVGRERRPSLDKEDEWNPRKKFKRNKHHTVDRPARQREQRRYQRQRNKLKTIRDELPQLLFQKKPEEIDDAFSIFKLANVEQARSQKHRQDYSQPYRHVSVLKKQLDRLLDRKQKDADKNADAKGRGEKLKRGTSTTGSSLRKDQQMIQPQKIPYNGKVKINQGNHKISLTDYLIAPDENQDGYTKQQSQKIVGNLPGYSSDYGKKKSLQRNKSLQAQFFNPIQFKGFVRQQEIQNIIHLPPFSFNHHLQPELHSEEPLKSKQIQAQNNRLGPEKYYQVQNSQNFHRPPYRLSFPQFDYNITHNPYVEGCLLKLQTESQDNIFHRYPFSHLPSNITTQRAHIINPHYGYQFPYYGPIQQLQERLPFIYPSFTHYLPIKQETIVPSSSSLRKHSKFSDSQTNKEQAIRRHHYAPRQPQNIIAQQLQLNLQRRRQ